MIEYSEGFLRLVKVGEAAVEYEKLELLLLFALKRKPAAVEGYNNLGNLYQKLRRHNDAVRCFERALEINPKYSVALNNLGVALERDYPVLNR